MTIQLEELVEKNSQHIQNGRNDVPVSYVLSIIAQIREENETLLNRIANGDTEFVNNLRESKPEIYSKIVDFLPDIIEGKFEERTKPDILANAVLDRLKYFIHPDDWYTFYMQFQMPMNPKSYIAGIVWELMKIIASDFIEIDRERLVDDTYEIYRPEFKFGANFCGLKYVLQSINKMSKNISGAIKMDILSHSEYTKLEKQVNGSSLNSVSNGNNKHTIYYFSYVSSDEYSKEMIGVFGEERWENSIEPDNFNLTIEHMQRLPTHCFSNDYKGRIVNNFKITDGDITRYYFAMEVPKITLGERLFKNGVFSEYIRRKLHKKNMNQSIYDDWESYVKNLDSLVDTYNLNHKLTRDKILTIIDRLIIIEQIDNDLFISEGIKDKVADMRMLLNIVDKLKLPDNLNGDNGLRYDKLSDLLRINNRKEVLDIGPKLSKAYHLIADKINEIDAQQGRIEFSGDVAINALAKAFSRAENKHGFFNTIYNYIDENQNDVVAYHSLRIGRVYELAHACAVHRSLVNPMTNGDEFFSAYYHDIGKVCIPQSTLSKKERFNDRDRSVMRMHTIDGAKLLRVMGFPEIYSDIARFHHEHYDGKGGYPGERKKNEIPFEACLAAVIDCFDACYSKRCYDDARPFGDAYQLIIKDSGTHFNPQAIQVFIDLYTMGILQELYEGTPGEVTINPVKKGRFSDKEFFKHAKENIIPAYYSVNRPLIDYSPINYVIKRDVTT